MRLMSRRPCARQVLVALLLLGALATIAQLGSVPHLHAGARAGLYNADHDLTLLAGLAAHGVQIAAGPALTIDVVSTTTTPFTPERFSSRSARSADSRAPPSA